MEHRSALPGLLVMAVMVVVALSGCGTAATEPQGVDLLEVPTRSPTPSDFVEGIDHPYLVLEESTVREYPAGEATVQVTVEPGPEIAGVATVSRIRESRGVQVIDHLAQDRQGNVWWFGREGEWEAGVADAEAGLLLAATVRRGDGYRPYDAPGAAVIVTVEQGAVESTDSVEVSWRGPRGRTVVTYLAEEGIGAVTGPDPMAG